jgi:nitronate monooxygenase
MNLDTEFTRAVGIELPIICGPMYPCSNPELVAAASAAGGIGVLQPVSLTYVHGHDFREGLRCIRSLTDRPIGMNALIEKSSKMYQDRMAKWVDIALEEGVRFFITSLGNPKWIVERAASVGGVVYHDVTERKWAEKGLAGGVHGLIAVNRRAGGHAGPKSAEQLFDELAGYGVPLIAAGGIGTPDDFTAAMRIGYAGVQMGTRFIATTECTASEPYKRAIINAGEDDIVLSERITGVPVAVINTPHIERMGLTAGPILRRLLRGRRTKHWTRTWFAIRSGIALKKASLDASGTHDFWQAGKSVEGIHEVKPVAEIMGDFAAAAEAES